MIVGDGAVEQDLSSTPIGAATGPGVIESPGRTLRVGLVLLNSIVAFEAMAVTTVMPLVEDDLGALWLYGWVFSAFFLGSLVGVVLAASAADRMRPWIPMVAGVAVFLVGLVVAGAAPSMLVLVVGRALQGLGAGTMPAIAYVCVGRSFPAAERPRMLAWLSSSWMIPAVAGPLLAAWIGETVGWRWVFLGLLPLTALFGVVALVGIRVVPSSDHPDAPHNLVPAIGIASGAGVLLAALAASTWWVVLVGAAIGVVVVAPAYRRLTPPGVVRAAVGLPATIAVRGLMSAGFHAVDVYVPFAVTTVRGASPLIGGLALMTGSFTWTLASWLQVRWIVRFGPVWLVRVGMAAIAIGALVMIAVLVPGVPVASALVAWGIAGFGIGLAWAPIMQGALSRARHGREGEITTAMQVTDMLGIALGTGLAGVIVAGLERSTGRPTPGLLVTFVLGAALCALGAALAPRLRFTLHGTGDPGSVAADRH